MSQTEKYNVATFIEKMVFAKSYSAQLARSTAGARVAAGSVGWTGDGRGSCMNPRVLIDVTSRRVKLRRMPRCRTFCLPRLNRRAIAPVVLALLLSACERRHAAARTDSAAPVASAAADVAQRRRGAGGGSRAAGPGLLIPRPRRDE